MTPDQVEDAGWSPEDWASFNDLAAATVQANASLRKIIPRGADAPNAYLVEVPSAAPAAPAPGAPAYGFDVGDAIKPSRIRVPFVVKADQVHDVENIRALVQRVARQLAKWEDRVIALGPLAGRDPYVSPTVDPRAKALLDPVFSSRSGIVIDRLKDGVKELLTRGHAKPLHAAFGFDAHMDLVDDPTTKRPYVERACDLLEVEDGAFGTIPPFAPYDGRLAVFTPDPGALDLVWTQRPHLAFVNTDANGDLHLRLEEAFLLRIKDGTAVVVIDQTQKDG